MIKRHIADELTHLLGEYPVVTLLGPKQAGKTTLARELINSRPKILEPYDYSNLETPEIRQFAIDDPKAFLAQFKKNVILDEIQRVPELLSYIQTTIAQILLCRNRTAGIFIGHRETRTGFTRSAGGTDV